MCPIGPLPILLICFERSPALDGSFADSILVLVQFWWPVLPLPNTELLSVVLSNEVPFYYVLNESHNSNREHFSKQKEFYNSCSGTLG